MCYYHTVSIEQACSSVCVHCVSPLFKSPDQWHLTAFSLYTVDLKGGVCIKAERYKRFKRYKSFRKISTSHKTPLFFTRAVKRVPFSGIDLTCLMLVIQAIRYVWHVVHKPFFSVIAGQMESLTIAVAKDRSLSLSGRG